MRCICGDAKEESREIKGFFSEEGLSVRKALLIWRKLKGYVIIKYLKVLDADSAQYPLRFSISE